MTIKSGIKRSYHELLHRIRRVGLHSKDFSIISKNCAGGFVYQYFGIKYMTPTAGLFFTTDDYLRLISNPRHYFTASLKPLKPEFSSLYLKSFSPISYPVGIIDDIEVYFMHYPTWEDAYEKWTRRAARVNYGKMFFLLTENDYLMPQQIEAFEHLVKRNGNRGLCLTRREYESPYTLFVPEMSNKGEIWYDHNVTEATNWKKLLNSL